MASQRKSERMRPLALPFGKGFRFARYCGKMYSCHIYYLFALKFLGTNAEIASERDIRGAKTLVRELGVTIALACYLHILVADPGEGPGPPPYFFGNSAFSLICGHYLRRIQHSYSLGEGLDPPPHSPHEF